MEAVSSGSQKFDWLAEEEFCGIIHTPSNITMFSTQNLKYLIISTHSSEATGYIHYGQMCCVYNMPQKLTSWEALWEQ